MNKNQVTNIPLPIWCTHTQCWIKSSIAVCGDQNAPALRFMLQVRCNCVECVSSSDVDSLRHSRSRLNIYKALSSPSLIALSSEDPFLTAFRLSWELQELSKVSSTVELSFWEVKKNCINYIYYLTSCDFQWPIRLLTNHDLPLTVK